MTYALEMRNITKRFQSVVANDAVDLLVKAGSIHAIIGENGAGKTTLMNVLYGLYRPDVGEIFIRGEKETLQSAMDAIQCGIGMVHQHFNLIPRLSVTDNIVLGNEPTKGVRYDWSKAQQKVEQVCAEYGISIDATKKVADISLGMKQRVEIVKTLYRGANIIILDEPTAVLTPQEIDELGKTLIGLKQRGKTILIITHKLEEVMDFSDEITVLRNGKHVVTMEKEQTTIEELTGYMVGREVHLGGQKLATTYEGEMLKLSNVSCFKGDQPVLQDISLTVKNGEILGIAGIDGSGQSELTELIAGVLPCQKGSIIYLGEEINTQSIGTRKEAGIAFIPQDRHLNGLILDFSIEENLLLGSQRLEKFKKKNFLQNRSAIHQMALERIKAYDIRPTQKSLKASVLSGGNQQKVIIAREMGRAPQLIVADQPTRGVDIGAIESIHNILVEHRNRGGSVILASLELDEVLLLSDRIAVMYEGRVVSILDSKTATREKIGLLMVGRKEECDN